MKIDLRPGAVNKVDRRTKEFRRLVVMTEFGTPDPITHKTTLKKWNEKKCQS